MRVEASWLAVAAGLLLAGCRTEGGASEDRGDRYSARGQFADAAVEYEIALEAAGEKAPSELRLKAEWRTAIAAELEAAPGLILDVRSEGYADLGPVPRRPDSVFVRVVSEDEHGRRRALNHFNKRAKGLFVRALLEDRAEPADVDGLLAWAGERGIRLERSAGGSSVGELQLVA